MIKIVCTNSYIDELVRTRVVINLEKEETHIPALWYTSKSVSNETN